MLIKVISLSKFEAWFTSLNPRTRIASSQPPCHLDFDVSLFDLVHFYEDELNKIVYCIFYFNIINGSYRLYLYEDELYKIYW